MVKTSDFVEHIQGLIADAKKVKAEMFQKVTKFEIAFDWDWQFIQKYENVSEEEYQGISTNK